MKRIGVAAMLCIGLSGCSSLTNVFDDLTPDEVNVWSDPVFENETARLTYNSELLSRVEPFVSNQRASDLYVTVRTGLQETSGPINFSIDRLPAYYITVRSAPAEGEFGVFPLDSTSYNGLLKDYLGDRVVQVNRLCDAYFRELDGIAGGADFGQASLNTLGDYGSVIMGLTGSPAKSLAILAGTQAALNETVDAATVLLLLSPAPSTVRALVDARQRRLLSDADDDILRTATHQKVETLVQAYALTCTPVGIRAIINEAVTERTRAEDPDRTTIAGQTLLVALEGALNVGLPVAERVGSLDEETAAHLLWLSRTADCADEGNPLCAVRERIVARMPKIVAAFDKNRAAAVTKLEELASTEPSIRSRATGLDTAYLAEVDEERNALRDAELQRLRDEIRDLRRPPSVRPPAAVPADEANAAGDSPAAPVEDAGTPVPDPDPAGAAASGTPVTTPTPENDQG